MKAFITVGAPGCGKSTWANGLGITDINLDACRLLVSGDEGNQECTPQAVSLRDKLILKASQNKDSDTNANRNLRRRLIKRLHSLGYEVIIVMFKAPLEKCKAQNLKRKRQVSEATIERIYGAIQDNPPLPEDADGFIALYPCRHCNAVSEYGDYCSPGCAEDHSYPSEETWEPNKSFYPLNDRKLDHGKDHINQEYLF